ncbi:MAG: cob(I)yrinic acid a,c-diamide adenosyltransferase [Planctomycetes bacterium]|nr:cob(I)yrinic acid a,c-diamide adenosyltransferase [Planctomycetota bacterium]
MKLYTRKGDEGFTGLIGTKRVRKDDPQINAVGAIDELNCVIGWTLREAEQVNHVLITSVLQPIQQTLFAIGSRLASLGAGKQMLKLPGDVVEHIERYIDSICEDLSPLKEFILPGGCELACRLHISRCACREAERAVVHLLSPSGTQPMHDPVAVTYLNRLSDLLLVLARLANRDASEPEITWHPDGPATQGS